jgi:4-hydroxybenzoate polyprenyltransferase
MSVRVPSAICLALSDIKIAHSVFALPFALLAAVMASPATRGEGAWGTLLAQGGVVVLCMFLARTWAMLVNRVADWRFDKDNPRTARRVIASGQLTEAAAVRIALGFAAAFVGATGLFWLLFHNPWPLALSVPVLVWIAFYSYTKRFTAWCHVFLGGALAGSPLAAAIAIDPAFLFSSDGLSLWFLAGMVLCWVAGFDIAYALQDLDFDRRTGLNSVPARLGVKRSLWLSRGLHVVAFLLLACCVAFDIRFGLLMRMATALVASLLVFEHWVLAKRGLAGLPMAFFTINGVVSVTLGVAGIVDVVNG